MKTLYRLIGVQPFATATEIKHAFRREIARYHPDKVHHLGPELQEIAATRAAELTEAYRILMNPVARQQYDEELRNEVGPPDAAAPGEPPVTPAAPPPSPDTTVQYEDISVGEALEQTRATFSAVVKRAALRRLRDAVHAVCDATPINVAGFDAGYDCTGQRGFYRTPQPALRLLTRVVPEVDPAAIEESWPLALRARAAAASVCIMLVGQAIAPANELAAAIAEHRRRSRNTGPPVVPVNFRDWGALLPPETPALARSIVERLRQGE